MNCAPSLFKKIVTITPKVLLLPFTTTTLFHNLPHVSSLILCLVEKWRENNGERKMGEKILFSSVWFRKENWKEGKYERKQVTWAHKNLSPQIGKKTEERKGSNLKWHIYPLRLSIWVKVSQVVVALCRPSKFHAVDFATHKISHCLTSPPTKSHKLPSPPTKSCFLFL